MTKKEFIKKCEELGVPYCDCSEERKTQTVFVCAKDAYNKKKKHPRKYKNLYVPYLRVSHFEDGELYIRDNGWCQYADDDSIKCLLERLACE